MNGGTCYTISSTQYYCNCASSYSGSNCATILNSCSSMVCLNNGYCTLNQNGVPLCICQNGYTGTNIYLYAKVYINSSINLIDFNQCTSFKTFDWTISSFN